MDPYSRDVDLLLARAGWPRVLHHLLAGLSHDVNGRVTALGGVAQLLALGDDPSSMTAHLEEEVRRLRLAAKHNALLVALHRPGAAEPVALDRTLPEVVALHGRHRSLRLVERTLDIGAPVPCVVARAGLLLPTILLVLTAAGEEAADREGRVEVSLVASHDSVNVACRCSGVPRREVERESAATEALAEVSALAEAGGSTLEWEAGFEAARFELRLPQTARPPAR